MGEQGYPNEICGLLLGKDGDAAARSAIRCPWRTLLKRESSTTVT